MFYDNEGVLVPATAGYPELTVPAGVSDEGAPRGATFVAGRNEDEKLLNIAYSFEPENRRTCNSRELPELEPPSIDERLNASSTTSRTNKLKRKNGES